MCIYAFNTVIKVISSWCIGHVHCNYFDKVYIIQTRYSEIVTVS